MIDSPWIAALFALFTWWFSTGAILWVVKNADRGGPDAHLLSGIFGLPFLAAGIWGIWLTLDLTTTAAVYGSFVSALAIWGWIELAFLAGLVTGPNRSPCPPGTYGVERFLRAWGTIASHEALLVVALSVLAAVSLGAENPFGFYTFALLYVARIFAKLNLFFGVPKINLEFLPTTLAHLPSHFRQTRQSLFFPVSVVLLALTLGCWMARLMENDGARGVGFALLTAMTALALLEHVLMVMRLPDERLWRWMLPAPKPNDKTLTQGKTHGL